LKFVGQGAWNMVKSESILRYRMAKLLLLALIFFLTPNNIFAAEGDLDP
jgi:hypothetical protein